MSRNGAMVEAPICPPKGTNVQLIRGSLLAHGEIIWAEDGRCGLRFVSDVSVKDWLASPAKVEQQRVDEIVSLVKAGAMPPEFGVARAPGAEMEADEGVLGELEQVVALLLDLEAGLAASNETLQRHASKLQNLDIAVQMLRAIVNKLAGTAQEGATLEDLSVVCAAALAKRRWWLVAGKTSLMVSVIVILSTRQVSGQIARMTPRATHASRLMLPGGRAPVASGMLIQAVSEAM